MRRPNGARDPCGLSAAGAGLGCGAAPETAGPASTRRRRVSTFEPIRTRTVGVGRLGWVTSSNTIGRAPPPAAGPTWRPHRGQGSAAAMRPTRSSQSEARRTAAELGSCPETFPGARTPVMPESNGPVKFPLRTALDTSSNDVESGIQSYRDAGQGESQPTSAPLRLLFILFAIYMLSRI
jgi:hypothetical protein